MSSNNFKIIIAGVGGQGVITLTQLIAQAAFVEGLEVRSSELHGLSQRGGSVETHIVFGKKVYSPLVGQREADLILSLEILETLRKINYSNKKTKFLINGYSLPYTGSPSDKEISKMIGSDIKQEKHIVPASRICKEKLGKEVLSGTYLLGFAVYNKLIPLRPESVLRAVKDIMPAKYQQMNIKAFGLAQND